MTILNVTEKKKKKRTKAVNGTTTTTMTTTRQNGGGQNATMPGVISASRKRRKKPANNEDPNGHQTTLDYLSTACHRYRLTDSCTVDLSSMGISEMNSFSGRDQSDPIISTFQSDRFCVDPGRRRRGQHYQSTSNCVGGFDDGTVASQHLFRSHPTYSIFQDRMMNAVADDFDLDESLSPKRNSEDEHEECLIPHESDIPDLARATAAGDYQLSCSSSSCSRSVSLEDELDFRTQLLQCHGFSIKDVNADGNCLFRAVADQIYGDEELHGTVRKKCMDHIAVNTKSFKRYITEDIQQYIERKRQNHVYGNYIELVSISDLFCRQIEIYRYDADSISYVRGLRCSTVLPPIRLSFHCGQHYNSVCDGLYTPIVPFGPEDTAAAPFDRTLICVCDEESRKTPESVHEIEKAMMDDKLRSTDWEKTDEDIVRSVARLSYREWMQQKRTYCEAGVSATSSSHYLSPVVEFRAAMSSCQRPRSATIRCMPTTSTCSDEGSIRLCEDHIALQHAIAISTKEYHCRQLPGDAVTSMDVDLTTSEVSSMCENNPRSNQSDQE